MKLGLVFLILCLILGGCSDRDGLAPVVESNWLSSNPHAKQYVVVRGDTLYSIAFRYDKDYQQLALSNHLNPPYTLRVGQVIQLNARIAPRPSIRLKTPRQPYHQAPRNQMSYNASNVKLHWNWPLHGRVYKTYAPQLGKKGIDIVGQPSDTIHATNSGIVAYAGNGLSGYGNLIIIKHNSRFLSAYGNNSRNLVHEGQMVKEGQVIAQIGHLNRQVMGVHFEIRKDGKPVNPLNYLKKG